MTGTHYIAEMGILMGPVAITNTHSVGTVHEALIKYSVRGDLLSGRFTSWGLPVVAETWDGVLNDINGFHVRAEHVDHAVEDARSGAIAEGNVGGGTGMISHGFKGGTGTASRLLAAEEGGWTVGVLVQANHGQRRRFAVKGVPVGRELGPEEIPLPREGGAGEGSIIVVVATDAPLLPHQCTRLAQRATLGIGRTGGLGEDSSGDLILAFATGNRLRPPEEDPGGRTTSVEMVWNADMNPLFEAVADATEEAILNAMLAAQTMTGVDGNTVHALSGERLVDVMRRFDRM